MSNEINKLYKLKEKAYNKKKLNEAADLCNLIGVKLQESGKLEDALNEHKEELSLNKMLNDDNGTMVAHRRIGEVYSDLYKWDVALEHLQHYLTKSKSHDNKVETQRAYATLGRTYMQYAEVEDEQVKQKLLQSAETMFLKALGVCDRLDSSVDGKELAQMRCRVYHNLGLVVDMNEKYIKAIEFINQALDLCSQNHFEEDAYRAYAELSRIKLKMGSTDKALEDCKVSLKIAKKIKNSMMIADSFALLGFIFLSPDRDDALTSKKYFYKAYKSKHSNLEVRSTIENNLKTVVNICLSKELLSNDKNLTESERMKHLEKLGDSYSKMGLGKQAIDYYKKSLENAISNDAPMKYIASIHTSLAQTYKDINEYDKAFDHFQKEKNIQVQMSPKETVMTLIELSKLSDLMKLDPKLFIEEAIEISKSYPKLHMYVLKYQLDNLRLSNCEEEVVKANIIDLSSTYDIDPDRELSEVEQSETEDDEDIDLDLIEFYDSDDEEAPTRGRRRNVGRSISAKKTVSGEAPLHVASINGNLKLVKTLIAQKHEINVRDNCGWLPIHEACNHGHLEIVEALVEAGARINDRGGPECEGVTPLHDAACNGHHEIVSLLIQKGASMFIKDDKGQLSLDSVINSIANFESRSECESHYETKRILLEQMQKSGREFSVPGKSCFSSNIQRKKSCRKSSGNYEIDYQSQSLSKSSSLTSKSSGGDLYEEAIRGIGSNARKSLVDSVARTDSFQPIIDVKPLISEDDYVDDSSWLIDDVDVPYKKRKRSSNEYSIEWRNSSTETPIRKKTKQTKISPLVRRDYSPLPESKTEIDLVSPVKNTQVSDPRRQSREMNLSQNKDIAKLSVEVYNLKFSVPIADETKTVHWLEEEVSKMYMQKSGVLLELKIKDKNGKPLNSVESLSFILNFSSETYELVSDVLNVENKTSIIDSYAKACNKLDTIKYEDVSCILESMQATGILDLSDHFLRTEKEFEAVFYSIQHRSVQTLKLSSSCVGDSGFKMLLDSLYSPQFPQWLELRATNLSTESLETLCKVIKEKPFTIQNLHHLDLSYNDFSHCSLNQLKTVLSSPSLRILELASCNLCIDQESSTVDAFNTIESLVLNDNDLGLGCVNYLLASCSRLSRLSLSGSIKPSTTDSRMGKSLASLMSVGNECPLEHLDLSECNIRDKDLNVLSAYLYRCLSLTTLDLSCNRELSSNSVSQLLTELSNNTSVPLKNLSLHGIDQLSSNSDLTSCLIQTLEHKNHNNSSLKFLTLPHSSFTNSVSQKWSELHGSRAMVKSQCEQLILTVAP